MSAFFFSAVGSAWKCPRLGKRKTIEVLLIEIQEEIHHFAGWEGGVKGRRNFVNKNCVNKLAFPNKLVIQCYPSDALVTFRPAVLTSQRIALFNFAGRHAGVWDFLRSDICNQQRVPPERS